MYMHWDEDEWEFVFESRPCTACNGDLRKCNGMCNGMSSCGQRRRDPAEVAKIKAARQLAKEELTLARAAEITARRAAMAKDPQRVEPLNSSVSGPAPSEFIARQR